MKGVENLIVACVRIAKDMKKFGGLGHRKQACVHRKCTSLTRKGIVKIVIVTTYYLLLMFTSSS